MCDPKALPQFLISHVLLKAGPVAVWGWAVPLIRFGPRSAFSSPTFPSCLVDLIPFSTPKRVSSVSPSQLPFLRAPCCPLLSFADSAELTRRVRLSAPLAPAAWDWSGRNSDNPASVFAARGHLERPPTPKLSAAVFHMENAPTRSRRALKARFFTSVGKTFCRVVFS